MQENYMLLSKPEIHEVVDDKVRLCCDISDRGVWAGKKLVRKFWTDFDEPRKQRTLYYETSKEYEKFLCHERLDAFVVASLPWAMRTGQNIKCEAPVSAELLFNLNEILIPTLAKHCSELTRINIVAPTDSTSMSGEHVGTGLSLGVDSFFTVQEMLESKYEEQKLTHLMYTSSKGTEQEGKVLNHESRRRHEDCKKVAAALGIPLVFIHTNFRLEFPIGHARAHPFTNLSAVFALRKLWRFYYYSTAYDLSNFSVTNNSVGSADLYLLLVTHAFTTSELSFHPSGMHTTRWEKIDKISKNVVVQENLRVCLKAPENCNISNKCVRTLLDLDMLGHLDKFGKSFDVDYYLENKAWYLRLLYLRPDDVFLEATREYFLKSEPKLMAEAKHIADQELKERKVRAKDELLKKQKEKAERQAYKIHRQRKEIEQLKQELIKTQTSSAERVNLRRALGKIGEYIKGGKK